MNCVANRNGSFVLSTLLNLLSLSAFAASNGVTVMAQESPKTYRRFEVLDQGDRLAEMKITEETVVPRWARDVSQTEFVWLTEGNEKPRFDSPLVFVRSPVDPDQPFGDHNHQPSITWLQNGDVMAIWYSTSSESGTELTVLASRLRAQADQWDPSSEFFKAFQRNMHGSAIFHDGAGTLFHINGMGTLGGRGWAKLALLQRTSLDNGVTWTTPRAIGPEYTTRHQVISGTLRTSQGFLIQCCDADPGPNGGTAIHVSRDGGKTWSDAGYGADKPEFLTGGQGLGTVAGIHASVVELANGDLLALGRGDTIEGHMPQSVSRDMGQTWEYKPSPFPPIGGGQRLILRRMNEGPLLFVSFTSGNRNQPEANPQPFIDQQGQTFAGHGMYAAVSFDDGVTWPLRKLLTPGSGNWDGGAHTKEFIATPTRAEHAGYLASTQTPDNTIHLISSRLHYRFNLAWLLEGYTGPK
ncbi:MAG: sialidase family protein [Pirellulaceae bacterium]|nr:sialidase family protein [Pirellulaceae bacterium]